jgi:hypothetical protein
MRQLGVRVAPRWARHRVDLNAYHDPAAGICLSRKRDADTRVLRVLLVLLQLEDQHHANRVSGICRTHLGERIQPQPAGLSSRCGRRRFSLGGVRRRAGAVLCRRSHCLFVPGELTQRCRVSADAQRAGPATGLLAGHPGVLLRASKPSTGAESEVVTSHVRDGTRRRLFLTQGRDGRYPRRAQRREQ